MAALHGFEVGDTVILETQTRPDLKAMTWKVVGQEDNDWIRLESLDGEPRLRVAAAPAACIPLVNRPDPDASVTFVPVQPELDPPPPTSLVPVQPPSLASSLWDLWRQLYREGQRVHFVGVPIPPPTHPPSQDEAMMLGNSIMQALGQHTSGALASSQGPISSMSAGDWVWLRLPRWGNNWLVMQRRAQAHPHRQLCMFPDAATGWDVHFVSFGECQFVQMQDFDILKLCPQGAWVPYCSYCGKYLSPEHRLSKQHQNMQSWLLAAGGAWQAVTEQVAYRTAGLGLAWPRVPC